MRCSRDRPSRSSFVITNWSPARLVDSSALSSSGRRASVPEALSRKISSQPAACNASDCASGCWSRLETGLDLQWNGSHAKPVW
jgi:hypothetical protein